MSQAIDWREQVKAHPGASLGVVAGAGLVVGHWLGGKIVGGGARPSRAAAAAPAGGTSAGLLDGSLNRASTRVESLVNLVIDEVADAVETAAIVPLFARLRGYLRTSTTSAGPREDGPPAAGFASVAEPRPAAGEAAAWATRPRGNGGFDR